MKPKTDCMHRKPCSNFYWLSKQGNHSCPVSSAKRSSVRRFSILLVSNLLGVSNATVYAEDSALSKERCEHSFTPFSDIVFPISELEPGQTQISAVTTYAREGTTVFAGDVFILQDGTRLTSDRATYDKSKNRFQLEGDVHLTADNLKFRSDSGIFDKNLGSAVLSGADYILDKNNLRGSASSIVISTSDDTVTTLTDTSLTSCAPAQQDWLLTADEIEINHDEQYGSARDVVIEFMSVPFFYAPYMEFPVGDKRRSGLLIPEWSNSSKRGFELVQPWYWNIAPNHDATLAPHYMRKRGLQLDTQYRFLTRTTSGQLESAYLSDDRLTNEKRYHSQYRQQTSISDAMKLRIDVSDVSDIDYFDDFDNSLSATSLTHLNRSASLTHNTANWNSRLLVQSYETVDANILLSNRPYRKLPQLNLSGRQPLTDSGLELTLQTEWVTFEHEDPSNTTGNRFRFTPGFEWLLRGVSWYVKPAIMLSHTQYRVEDGSGNDLDIDDRNMLISSIDSGLQFERTLDNGMLQTLEPRLFYLNAPFRDQSLYPIFDTNVPTFSFAQLFRSNRFNGGDRIGDANQLTAAISSRLIDPADGNEYLRVSLGQISYFDDRRVTLDNSVTVRERSDLIAEVGSQWHNWQARASLQWNDNTRRSERQNFLLHYQSDQQHILNLGYQEQSATLAGTEISQSDVSFMTPVSDNTSLFARWNYSHTDHQDIDIIGGIGYENCCWSLQLLAQRQRLNNSSDEYDNSMMIQLVLKGLGSVSGQRLDNTLRNAILGYGADI